MADSAADGVSVTFVGHASVALELGGLTVITDPVLTMRLKHLRRVGAPPAEFDPGSVDIVLLSHQHHDHLHVPSLRLLPRSAHLVVARGVRPVVERLGFEQVTEVAVGDVVIHDDPAGGEAVAITAVPAVHDDRRHPGRQRVRPIGFLIESAGWSGYFPGDTAIYDDMAGLAPALDLALIPVWGWGPTLGGGHLDPVGAAQALGLLRARQAIPIHWGTLWPYHVRPNDRLVLPPKELLSAVAERGIETDVIELAPGASTTL